MSTHLGGSFDCDFTHVNYVKIKNSNIWNQVASKGIEPQSLKMFTWVHSQLGY